MYVTKRFSSNFSKVQTSRLVYLLLGITIGVNSEVNVTHEPLDHTDGVRALSFGVVCFLHNNGGNVSKLIRQLGLPLFPGDLKLALIQNLKTRTNAQSSYQNSLGKKREQD